MLLRSYHSSLSWDSDMELTCGISLLIVIIWLLVEGKGLVLRIVAYNPLSWAVAKSSLFQESQLSQPNFGLMSRNLWISCFR